MSKIRKIQAEWDCPIVLSEEFIVQSSKNIIDAESDNENERTISAPVLTSPEMRNIMKNMRSYLDGEMNNKMDDIKQFVDNLTLKNQSKEKYQTIFQTQMFCLTKTMKILY
ncbi:hypothetical protein TNCV_3769121 [Trichonephila clavipes]|nr:hypothetical protein TNCV_3769121 [Trichonephila clavipes]